MPAWGKVLVTGYEIVTQKPNFYLMWADTGLEAYCAVISGRGRIAGADLAVGYRNRRFVAGSSRTLDLSNVRHAVGYVGLHEVGGDSWNNTRAGEIPINKINKKRFEIKSVNAIIFKILFIIILKHMLQSLIQYE